MLAFAPASAHANHIPGATYRGVAATGGTVEFDVSADGGAVTRFVVANVPGYCGGTIAMSFAGVLPIVGHAFSGDAADVIRFEGSFPSRGQAAGTLLQTSCPGSPLSWTAATAVAIAPVPDTTPPTVEIRGRHPLPLRRDGKVPVRIACPSEPCHVTAGGVVSVQGARTRRFRLKPASAQLQQGASVRLEPKLGRRALAAARRALRARRRVEVRLTVSAVDGAGNRSASELSIPLRPRR